MRLRLIASLCLLALGLTPAAAPAFSGAQVPDVVHATSYASRLLLPRLVCPPRTQSTPRPGDFSFCSGTVELSIAGRVVAFAPFSVRTYDSHVIKVPLRRSARRRFRPGRRVRVHWRVRSHDGQGEWATREGDTTFLNTFKR